RDGAHSVCATRGGHETPCEEAGKHAGNPRPPPARESPQQDDGEAEQDQCGEEGGEPARRQRGPHPGGRESDGPQFRVGVHCGKLRLRTVAMPPPAAVPSPNLSLGDWSVAPRLRRRYGDVSPYPRSSPGCAGLRRRYLPPTFGWGTGPWFPASGGGTETFPPTPALRPAVPG